MLDQKGLGKLE